jgi:hypothetical protein
MYNTRADILTRIGRPNGTTSVVVNMHNTSDIIKQMQKALYDNSAFAKKIAYKFKGSTVKQTCRNIFNWLKENIEYRIEPAHLQTTKSLQRLVSDGYGDCKHYSGFFAAILSALNIKHHYRFTSYNNSTTPTHVYVVAYDEKNQPIYCDAVLEVFNTEKNYTHKIDKNMLAHLGNIDSIDSIGRRKSEPRRSSPNKDAKKAKRKERRDKAKEKLKKLPAGAKRVSLAPARAAFLSLVLLNVRGFANKLSMSNPSKLRQKWEKLGGDYGKLTDAINKGKGKKALLSGIDDDDNIGSVVGTAIATATPVVVALNNFLKQSGDALQKGKDLFKAATGQDLGNTPFNQDKDPGAPNTAAQEAKEAAEDAAEETGTSAGGGMGKNMLPLLIGGAAIAYFAFKKK